MTRNQSNNYNNSKKVVGSNSKLYGIVRGEKMSEFIKNENGCSLGNKNEMKAGYREMGMLNLSLSEEGLAQDRKDLESYENYLVESE